MYAACYILVGTTRGEEDDHMNGRERVRRAMHYQSVDKAPLQYYYCPVGYYEHGEKLNDLYERVPGDTRRHRFYRG